MLIERSIEEIVATKKPGEILYGSVNEFRTNNPDCCFVERPDTYKGKGFTFPAKDEIVLTLIFRRRAAGDTPYEVQHVAIGPCADDYEESRYSI